MGKNSRENTKEEIRRMNRERKKENDIKGALKKREHLRLSCGKRRIASRGNNRYVNICHGSITIADVLFSAEKRLRGKL